MLVLGMTGPGVASATSVHAEQNALRGSSDHNLLLHNPEPPTGEGLSFTIAGFDAQLNVPEQTQQATSELQKYIPTAPDPPALPPIFPHPNRTHPQSTT